MKAIIVEGATAPVVEIDTSSDSVYVRFKKNAKVAKTISPITSGPMVAVDLDKKNEVIGVELIGVKEFGIVTLLKKVPFLKTKVPLEKTRYVSTERASFDPDEDLVAA